MNLPSHGKTDGVHGEFMPVSRLLAVIMGVVQLTGTTTVLAQHGGSHAARSRPFICVYDCRDPEEAADLTRNDLKKFEQLMAVQATPEQSAAFARTQQDFEAASAELKSFRQVLENSPTPSVQPDYGATLGQILDRARTGNQKFLASFSAVQESGLKELITKLATADSDLGKEMTVLNEIFQAPQVPANVAGAAGNLDKALVSLQSERLTLGREMSILPGEEQNLTFFLPQMNTSAEIAGRQVSLPAAGEAVRTSVADGLSLFDLRLVVDFSDLQDNITDIFRSRLTSAPRCGEHIEVRQAMLLPQSAASLAVLRLHHERWICPPGAGSGGGEMLFAAGNATVEIKLSPSIDQDGSLHLVSEIGHVEADDVFRDSLLTGSVGTTLAGQISSVVLSAMKKGAEVESTLPPAARNQVTIQKAQFQAGGAGQLRLVLDGQLRLSEEQTKEFAVQLKQQLSAQETSPQ
jgi:hypothetical protein